MNESLASFESTPEMGMRMSMPVNLNKSSAGLIADDFSGIDKFEDTSMFGPV